MIYDFFKMRVVLVGYFFLYLLNILNLSLEAEVVEDGGKLIADHFIVAVVLGRFQENLNMAFIFAFILVKNALLHLADKRLDGGFQVILIKRS